MSFKVKIKKSKTERSLMSDFLIADLFPGNKDTGFRHNASSLAFVMSTKETSHAI